MAITKLFQNKEPLTIIIVSAGLNRKMKKGAKALIEIEGEKLILRQLRTLKKTFPHAEFIVVLGYCADLIYPILPSHVRCIENEFFETTNVVRSIALGLRASTTNQVLIVYGDLLFSRTTFHLPTSSSLFLLRSNPRHDVGANLDEKLVSHLSFASEFKWGQAVFLKGKELELFKKQCFIRDNKVLFGHEVLNTIMEQGAEFQAVFVDKLFELDTFSDLSRFRLSEEKF